MRSISGCDWIATASKPPICPITTNEGCNWPSDCIVVVGRMCSSLARMVSPLTSFTGITEFLKRPSSHAFAKIVALLERLQRRGRQRYRGHFVQRAIGFAAAAWRANVIIDICLRHDALLV